jgi:hypothetical protein
MHEATLEELRKRRAFECRLEPARALRSLAEAAAFLADRGILTRTPDSALPSLFGACHDEPYREGGRGFAAWPATGYPWFAQLADRPDVVELSVHNGKRVLLTAATAALADPLCRAGLAAAAQGGGDPAALLGHLAAAGPSPLADLKVELEWDAPRLRRARRPLERSGAVVSRSVTAPADGGGHVHTSVLARWDQAFPQTRAGSLADVLVACLRAAVLAPQAELARWFSWPARPDAALIDRLVADGRLVRPAPGWVAAPLGNAARPA